MVQAGLGDGGEAHPGGGGDGALVRVLKTGIRKQERDTFTDLRRGIIVFLTNQCTMIYTVFAFHTPLETKNFLFTPKNCA